MGAPAIAYVAVLAAGLVPMVVFLLVLRMAKEPAPRRKQGRPVIGHPLEVSNDVEARAQVQVQRTFDFPFLELSRYALPNPDRPRVGVGNHIHVRSARSRRSTIAAPGHEGS